jgi:hypothetical protein
MDSSTPDIESDLVDLSAISLDELRGCEPDTLTDSLRRLLRQVERPRPNFGGGSEHPTRAD